MSKHICCNLCTQTFPADDLDLELRKKRHEKLHGPALHPTSGTSSLEGLNSFRRMYKMLSFENFTFSLLPLLSTHRWQRVVL